MVTRMKINLGNLKIQLVASEKDFRDEELFVPEDVFSEAGAFVLTASSTKRAIRGMLAQHHRRLLPDAGIRIV